jgi:chemotaxis protein CheZ
MSEPAHEVAPLAPTERDFEAIEAAVMETQRGRWFLDEFKRRNRHADTLVILTMLERLERSVKREKAIPDIDRIRFDLAEMADAIERTKQEIAEIKAQTDDGNRFEQASNELDAIVTQTETATGDILGAAEKIQELAWTLREEGASSDICDRLDEHATNIYMACSFQDLTGQRTRKVVQVLKYLENRVHSMIEIWGLEDVEAPVRAPRDPSDTRPDAHLLNGPQLAGRGVNQAAVDDLFDPAQTVDAEPAADEHMSNAAVDALFDTVDMDTETGSDTANTLDAWGDADDASAIADDIEIVASAPATPIPMLDETVEDDETMIAGPSADGPIPDERDELVDAGDVFAAPQVDVDKIELTLPAIEADGGSVDQAADVFAPAPVMAPAALMEPQAPQVVAVGATLRVTQPSAMVAAEVAPQMAPLMAVEAAPDPLQAMTPATRLSLMG